MFIVHINWKIMIERLIFTLIKDSINVIFDYIKLCNDIATVIYADDRQRRKVTDVHISDRR